MDPLVWVYPKAQFWGHYCFSCIYDIHKAVLDAKVKLFADDTNLFLYGKNLCTLFDRANTCLQHMSKWFIANRLSLNVDNTCFCVFGNEKKITLTFS